MNELPPLNPVPPGRYRHYKGNEYTVLGTARHSESLEEMVVYRPEYGEHGLWVRPRRMFLESVTVDGAEVPRFRYLGAGSDKPVTSANLFADIPPHLPEEIVQTLLTAAEVRIERIVSLGHTSPADFWYDQDQAEWVVVLQGSARLRFETELLDLKPGDFVNIPAHTKHRVEWTTPDEPTLWLAVHYRARCS